MDGGFRCEFITRDLGMFVCSVDVTVRCERLMKYFLDEVERKFIIPACRWDLVIRHQYGKSFFHIFPNGNDRKFGSFGGWGAVVGR